MIGSNDHLHLQLVECRLHKGNGKRNGELKEVVRREVEGNILHYI